jgi:AICAR transformylase/IMP cyclohydrolase PurH
MSNNGGTTLALRRKFAARAFALSASYDSTIATWFGKQLAAEEGGVSNSSVVTRVYKPEFALKYGKESSSSCLQSLLLFISLFIHNYAHYITILH